MDSRRRHMCIVPLVVIGLLPGCSAPRAQSAPPSSQSPAAREQPAAAVNPITIDSSEEQIRQAVATARMGRKLTPKAWPNGARIAVCLTFDVDNELLQRANPLPVPLSVGEYGATTAVPRILDLLDRHQVPATFFIPAMGAMLHPDMLSSILSRHRHEVGVHGWIHEFWPGIGDAAKEERMLTSDIDYLTKATGRRPVGVRAPSSGFSPHTFGFIRKAGFLYDSSLLAADEPYDIVSNGQPSGVIELPIAEVSNDYVYYGETANGALPSPDAVFQIYKAEFDLAYQERTMFILTQHPHVGGRRSRIVNLDRLITYIKSKGDVWFATMEQVATYVKQQPRS
ncbi:MAG TPA: polysaccharide deacetylase [Vicinamibacterales bacterium]|jgi:peptidoglycan-N-acetylglucosamine deacetylase|nr:polysaccharide deacetylase [Vicinamibacterales bacterium]